MLAQSRNPAALLREALDEYYTRFHAEYRFNTAEDYQFRVTVDPESELGQFLSEHVPRGKMAEFLRYIAFFALGRMTTLDPDLLAKKLAARMGQVGPVEQVQDIQVSLVDFVDQFGVGGEGESEKQDWDDSDSAGRMPPIGGYKSTGG